MSGQHARFEYQFEDNAVSYSGARSQREFITSLKLNHQPMTIRGTGIICTIGPASQSVELLQELVHSGMNIARLNFSHGTYEYHQQTIDNIHQVMAQCHPHPLGLALDTKGPEIRTGNMKNGGEVSYVKGHEIKISCDPALKDTCCETQQFLEYPDLVSSVKPGSKIVIADGNFLLEVKEIVDGQNIMATVLNNATIGSRKNCNLPGAVITLPAVSEKDRKDLLFGVRNKVDMVFASFIRKRSDVAEVRAALGEEGKNIMVIAKIENREGIENIDEIIDASDGVMVARGDMGMEIPLEKVFLAQKMLIARCNKAGKPVICATQMLESMIKNPRPTRAEITDVGNAVIDGADCVMLSGETASGSYPLESCSIMHKICRQAASVQFDEATFQEISSGMHPLEATETTCIAAVNASYKMNAAAIIVLTTSGKTAFLLSKYRPRCPIITVARDEHVARTCHLYRGLFPLMYPQKRNPSWVADMNDRLEFGIAKGRDMGFIKKGSFVIFVTGWQPGASTTNTVRILQVQDNVILGSKAGDDITFK